MKKHGTGTRWILALAGLALAGAMTAGAAGTKIWTGAANTNWNDGGNWGGVVPGDGDDVIVTNTTTKPWMAAGTYPASGAFASFSISNGATVTCLGDTNAVNGGSVAVPYGTGVAIHCQSAIIAGTLTADSQGFPGLAGPGYANSCGSHGGRGGSGGGMIYGSLTQPSALGSGGLHGGFGGGAIRLLVDGLLQVSGAITAAGQNSGGAISGSAGGSLWITAGTLSGGGTISACGARRSDNPSEAGGGGGRVALDYSVSTFTGVVSVAGGYGATLPWGPTDGQPGTLWEPQRFENARGTAEAPTNVTVNQSFQYYFTNTVMRYWNLTVTNGAWFEVHSGAMSLSGLTLSNGTFNFDTYATNGQHGTLDMVSMSITGNVYMANNNNSAPFSKLWLPSGDYAFSAFSIGTGSWLYACGNTNAVNGGSVAVPYGTGVTIRCQTALINGTLTADYQGFPSATGPGYTAAIHGGSHGGRSGNDAVGKTYGSLTQPTALGSGGNASAGGGAIRLAAAGTVTMNGIISANGQVGQYGGAGGSIWITADTLAGTGTVRAAGASRGGNPSQGGGGGGRVAFEYSTSAFTGIVSAAGGYGATQPTYPPPSDGKMGTYFNCQWTDPDALPPFGNGVTLSDSYYVTVGNTNSFTNGVIIMRTVTEWKTWGTPSFTWTDRSLDGGSNQLNSVATYWLSGFAPNQKYWRITDNSVPMFGGAFTTCVSPGVLQFVVTLDAAHTINVQAQAAGTIFMIH